MVSCLVNKKMAKSQPMNDNLLLCCLVRDQKMLLTKPGVFLMLPLYLSINWHWFPKRASNCCVTACLLSIIPNDWLQFLTAWSCTFLFPQTFFCSRCLHVPQTVWSLLYFTPAAALAFCVFCCRYMSGSTHLCCEYHGFKPWKTFMSPNVPVTDFILPSDVQYGPQMVKMKPPYKL